MSLHEWWVLFAPLFELSAAAVAYGLLLMGLAKAVQPWRLRLAGLGEQLLASPRLTETDRAAVSFALDHAFSVLPALFAVVVVPCVMLVEAVRWVFGGRKDLAAEGPELRRMAMLSAVSFIAANPVCGAVAAIEFGLLATPAFIFVGQEAVIRLVIRLQRVEALGWRPETTRPPEHLLH